MIKLSNSLIRTRSMRILLYLLLGISNSVIGSECHYLKPPGMDNFKYPIELSFIVKVDGSLVKDTMMFGYPEDILKVMRSDQFMYWIGYKECNLVGPVQPTEL